MVRRSDRPLNEPALPAAPAGPAGRVRRLVTWLMEQPLPVPPERLRRGPFREGAFGPRSTRLTSQLGLLLGVAFGVCFVTGLLSHLIQHPPGWFWWPSRPVWLYRATQGVHVATGLASIPLLGAKLWSVYPRLFTWPPARTLLQAAERGGVAALVAGALFQLTSGVFNIARWYTPMPFFFTTGHYWVAWLTVGALLVHVSVQLPVVRDALGTRSEKRRTRLLDSPHPVRVGAEAGEADPGRRHVLLGAGIAAGLITVTTVGQTVRPLSRIAVLAPRRPTIGPQGLPVNKTALGAGVRESASDPAYTLTVTGPAGPVRLDLAALNALPQYTVVLPIACVEGWSASGTWTGVRLRDLVEMVGADPGRAHVLVESLQAGGHYGSSTVEPPLTADSFTLIALRLRGEVLHLDHGYPARLIAPNRPGVLQTKWVGRLTVREA
ncbi:molybdopterin-dependent oxidoreductase [Actinoplanes sp. NPDC051411]|uniref:molybdopterin-dependent oxidoreductase n=1 Tax=Actinoplanes sp. NPDC051411 TaxID=3155522 RepID=UPI00344485E7